MSSCDLFARRAPNGYSILREPAMPDLRDSASNLQFARGAALAGIFRAGPFWFGPCRHSRLERGGKAYLTTIRDRGKCFRQVRRVSVIARGWTPQRSRGLL
jgi:hypothetical protein